MQNENVYTITLKNGEQGLYDAAARVLQEGLCSMSYRLDGRTKEGKELQRCISMIADIRESMRENNNFSAKRKK